MRQTLALSMVLGTLLLGCASTLLYPHDTMQAVVVPVPPDMAYPHAVQSLVAMGGTVTQSDSVTRILTGSVHQIVVLTVQVQAEGAESLVQIRGHVVPGKLVVGTFDEVDTYIAMLCKEVACQRRQS